ncbi:P-loop containing nucleoside triphosphate hydrolase protein [Amylocarpus encephaloides]|uniref:P-loop containing nucleoside triphosphate hydrolase protein n=1 Tax=Amylocarpus encephaloides TaxID=45428 RepID=A0A9P7YFS0_9HELO|nr:P-loop containing nucleoside triphosphate hydrolase protein [Amylocarpus encephaloides]
MPSLADPFNFDEEQDSYPSVTPLESPGEPTTSSPSSLEIFQNDEQRRVLDTVARVRKCGLDGVVSLPQIVVCGSQSAGKSSVLEALTEIPFPRNDLLCTRYATEINLKNGLENKITLTIVPDPARPSSKQESIRAWTSSIPNFDNLPAVMDEARGIMGIKTADEIEQGESAPGFARDVLSVVFEGPNRPQLSLVDIPGLISAATKNTTHADIQMVAEITRHYIESPRTICLAVVAASADYATQNILDRVREVDPNGDRTLGVITKPDMAEEGSGLEEGFIKLANNEDIFFKLGWHVVKNRAFKETNSTLAERNAAEQTFFRTTNWRRLDPEAVGVDALRRRLSQLLFEHVKKELPALREELDDLLHSTNEKLEQLGTARSSGVECKSYLSHLSLEIYKIAKAAVDGHYEGSYFHEDVDPDFNISSPSTISRTRAIVQSMNSQFSNIMHTKGHKYFIEMDIPHDGTKPHAAIIHSKQKGGPTKLTKTEAIHWVAKALRRNRGKELIGNFNPLLIGELFWELSSPWHALARTHVNDVADICTRFFKTLLHAKCPEDVERRIWGSKIKDELEVRYKNAILELNMLMEDHKNYPINYNHYYTETIAKRRRERQKAVLDREIGENTREVYDEELEDYKNEVDFANVLENVSRNVDANMENFSSEEVLDSLLAIYKVSAKTFVANVTTQVVERHIIRGLEDIFSPVFVGNLEAKEAEALASEPGNAKRERGHLLEQIKRLEEGREIFKEVLLG